MNAKSEIDRDLMGQIFDAQGKSFRGGLIENAKRFRLQGSGYDAMPKEQDGYFKIETARQIAGPLRALADDAVRQVHVIGATQVLKSLVGDIWVPYWFEHLLQKMLVLFEDDGKAELFCSQRLMETLKFHPVLGKWRAQAMKESRWNVTGTWIKIAGVELLVCGLNEGNVSTLSWPAIWVSEAWQHGKDGLLEKAFKRADRYPDTYKILNESQAGETDSDLAAAVKVAHQVPLEWECPACGGIQTWEWKHWNHRRPSDFKPREQKTISTIIVGGSIATVSQQPAPGTYAGMRFGKNPVAGLLDDNNDDWSIQDRAASAYWECIWCGRRINDTETERRAICETYRQEYRILDKTGATPKWRTPDKVAFTIPREANYSNKFKPTVERFLVAKEAKRAGQPLKLKDWFMSERAVFYDDNVDVRRSVMLSTSSYDPAKYMALMGERFHCVQMTVDCHKALDAREDEARIGTFWLEVRAFEKQGHSMQLARGWVLSWDLVKAQQIYWRVPAARVFVDCAWMPDQVAEAAVKYHDMVSGPAGTVYANVKVPMTWFLCEGAKPNQRLTLRGKAAAYACAPEPGIRSYTDANGKTTRMQLYKLWWNGRSFEQQFDSILSKGVSIRWDWLKKEELVIVDVDQKPSAKLLAISLDRERGNGAYEEMLNSRHYDERKRAYLDWDKKAWTLFRPSTIEADGTISKEGSDVPGRPTEARDSGLMHLAGVAQDGLLGHVALEQEQQ